MPSRPLLAAPSWAAPISAAPSWAAPSWAAPIWAALSGLALAACTSNGPAYPPSGPCVPTTQGAPSGAYGDYDTAREAFSRSSGCGSFVAVLEDVAWLRFEGCEEEVLKKHRAYFEQGYTTFEVALFTKEFTQPTGETFVLEDSRGARLTGRPVSYQGTMGQEGERFAARFSVSFRHSLTADLDWLRLTRVADGASLEWIFRPSAPGPAAAGPAAPGSAAGGAGAPPQAYERPENLLKPRNAAPAPLTTPTGRPVNLLSVPGAGPASFPAATPAAASPSVGEPAWAEPAAAQPATPPPAAPLPTPALPAAPGQLPPPAVRTVR